MRWDGCWRGEKGLTIAQAWQGRGLLAMASSCSALDQGMTVLMTGAVPIRDSQAFSPRRRPAQPIGRDAQWAH